TEMVETDDLKHVMHLLDKMDKREATVLRMRFGLDDEEPKTLKEIGECLGLTRERVRQIESEALAKLSENLSVERSRRGGVIWTLREWTRSSSAFGASAPSTWSKTGR